MKISHVPLAGLLPVLTLVPIFGQSPGTPVISTPGSATWSNEITSTGTRTTFTITDNTVIDWGQFDLSSGSELIFDFIGGESVVNMLGGDGVNFISGTVTSNGNVGFFSPNADLVVDGSVTAKSVTIASLNVDQSAFLGGESFTMSGSQGAFNGLSVSGEIRSTDGDVVLASRFTEISGNAKLRSKNAIRIAGSSDVTVQRAGNGRRLKENSGSGFVLHLGDSRANRIEIAAGAEVNNGGRLRVGFGRRIFLEVGDHGKILEEGNGLMVGRVSVNGSFDKNGVELGPNDGDSAGAVSNSTVKIPALLRTDGTSVNKSRMLVNHVPMSASADSSRDRKSNNRQVVKNEKSLLKRASFFGMRGGSAAPKKR